MYYESHVTIEPVFDEKLSEARRFASIYGFRTADLLMQKRKSDTPERSKSDTFMTSRGEDQVELADRMTKLCMSLKTAGYKIYRYKIEHIILDSRYEDTFHLLSGSRVGDDTDTAI